MIIWNAQFKTGSDTIDQQHQILIHNINHLECMLGETSPTKETWAFLINLLDFLECYTRQHFRFEEGCMEQHRCPVHAANKQAHETFLAFFKQFKEDTRRNGIRPDAIRTLHQTISQWIQEHILRVDTQLKPCLNAGG
jgi:hemerythrin